MRFLDLSLGDDVPDAKTIWLFREQLTEAGVVKKPFERFETYLCEQWFSARQGQIADASIVPVPRQRNSREEISESGKERSQKTGASKTSEEFLLTSFAER